ncbi:unnamed protein product [Soboliphyme baturini]|uniref:Translation initiation factor eIF2B subunit beta n=1 Tax=Soboliphyme baturini TaxID=241478 RepID=A0A183IKQ8_9BILA|nr:unnamed protein product [Soboliphyme baturini]
MSANEFASKRLAFLHDLHSGKVTGGYKTALETVNYVRRTVATAKWNSAEDLMKLLQRECRYFTLCLPKCYVVTNMIKRILRLIRDEHLRLAGASEEIIRDPYDSLPRLWEEDTIQETATSVKHLRTSLIETVHEFVTEIETCSDNIAIQALDHINTNDTVMTIGFSTTVERFLLSAGKTRRFNVYIAECAPSYSGRNLMTILRTCPNIQAELIPDAKIFCCMSQTDKVIIGASEVLANGGIRAMCGTYTMCLCASHFCVPVIVCASFYKLTPVFVSGDDQEAFNELRSPAEVVSFSSDVVTKMDIRNPAYDCVSPDLITLLITNVSGNAPSYIYRLINELYHPADLLL